MAVSIGGVVWGRPSAWGKDVSEEKVKTVQDVKSERSLGSLETVCTCYIGWGLTKLSSWKFLKRR